MTSDDFAERVAGIAALAEPVRRDLYLFVTAQPDSVGRDEAAAGIGVPRHIAKFHLDRLVEDGLLDIEFKRLSGRRGPGAGRPSKLYRRAPGVVAVSLPDRHYDLAGRLMAQAIEDSGRDGKAVLDALSDAATAFGAWLGEQARRTAHAPDSLDVEREAAIQVLVANGYEPRLQDDTITLRNCPFDALAREHTELICGMNLALIEGLTGRLDGEFASVLDPSQDRCCVVVSVG
jgi:predicted ArsR family transcriptional regulator